MVIIRMEWMNVGIKCHVRMVHRAPEVSMYNVCGQKHRGVLRPCIHHEKTHPKQNKTDDQSNNMQAKREITRNWMLYVIL